MELFSTMLRSALDSFPTVYETIDFLSQYMRLFLTVKMCTKYTLTEVTWSDSIEPDKDPHPFVPKSQTVCQTSLLSCHLRLRYIGKNTTSNFIVFLFIPKLGFCMDSHRDKDERLPLVMYFTIQRKMVVLLVEFLCQNYSSRIWKVIHYKARYFDTFILNEVVIMANIYEQSPSPLCRSSLLLRRSFWSISIH